MNESNKVTKCRLDESQRRSCMLRYVNYVLLHEQCQIIILWKVNPNGWINLHLSQKQTNAYH